MEIKGERGPDQEIEVSRFGHRPIPGAHSYGEISNVRYDLFCGSLNLERGRILGHDHSVLYGQPILFFSESSELIARDNDVHSLPQAELRTLEGVARSPGSVKIDVRTLKQP